MAPATYAQLQHRPVTLGGGLEIAIPFGEFDQALDKQMVGVSANLTVPMRLLPFDIGFDFSWARMGSVRDVVTVNDEYVDATTGDLRTRSEVYGYHGQLRFKPFNGKVSPYIEGMAGLRQFTTRTDITVDGLDQPIMTQRNANSFVGSYGWAVGIQVAPTKVFYIEGRVERLEGGRVSYVDPRSIAVSPDGDVSYATVSSGANVVNVHLGIGFRF
jgi:opacity protein-like surface antigen